ncbi:hypothetical protein BKA81DRAFT_381251 [Phyllosticta paracitricarpa]
MDLRNTAGAPGGMHKHEKGVQIAQGAPFPPTVRNALTGADKQRSLVAQIISAAKVLPGLNNERFATERAATLFLFEALVDQIQAVAALHRLMDMRAIFQDAVKELAREGYICLGASVGQKASAGLPKASKIESSKAVVKAQAQPPAIVAPSSAPIVKIEGSDGDPVDLDKDAVKKFWTQVVVAKYKELGFSATARDFPDKVEAQVYFCNAMRGQLQLPVFKYHDSWTANSILCREAVEELVRRQCITFPARATDKEVSEPKAESQLSKKKSVKGKGRVSKSAFQVSKDDADMWTAILVDSVSSKVPRASRPRKFDNRHRAFNFLVDSAAKVVPAIRPGCKITATWKKLCHLALDISRVKGHIFFPAEEKIQEVKGRPLALEAASQTASGHEASQEDTRYQAGRADAFAEAMQQLLQKQPPQDLDNQGTSHICNADALLSNQREGSHKTENESPATKTTNSALTTATESKQSSTVAGIFHDLSNTSRYRSPARESHSSSGESTSGTRWESDQRGEVGRNRMSGENESRPGQRLRTFADDFHASRGGTRQPLFSAAPFPNPNLAAGKAAQGMTGFYAYSSRQASFAHPPHMNTADAPFAISSSKPTAGHLLASNQAGFASRKRLLGEIDSSVTTGSPTQKRVLR